MLDVHVLVVCPDGDMLNKVDAQLKRSGFRDIFCAQSAARALDHIRKVRVDCLLTTVDLKDIDGWRLARLVRSGALNCAVDTPIVMMTEVWCQRIAETTAKEYSVNYMLSSNQLELLGDVVERCVSGKYPLNSKPRLLVIEDSRDTADLVKRVLDRQYQVDLCDDGEEGIECWRRYQHSLILLDYMLPKISGEEILERIMAENPRQVVVMMTAHASSELAEKIIFKGAVDFLPKPFRTEQLRKVCDLAVRRDDFITSNEQFEQQVRSLEDSRHAYRLISEKHQQLLHNLQTVVMEMDGQFRLRFLNYPWKVLMGYDIEESLGYRLVHFMPPGSTLIYENFERQIASVLDGKVAHCEAELCLVDRNQQNLWAQLKVRRVDQQGKAALTICLDNITKRKEAQEQLEYLAMHDSLTGLFNRRYFEESLRHAYADSVRNSRSHGLLYIDLDHFKVINDTFGHHEGDEVLRQISTLMSRRIRASDMLCRLGGDEYAVLVHNIEQQGTVELALDIQNIVNQFTYQAKGHKVTLGCSIGIAIVDGEARCGDEYLMQADIALYVAKGRGRNIVHVYNANDNESEELRSRINWTQKIREALLEQRIVLHFQPVYDSLKKEVAYYEALVRMRDANGNLIYPNSFIPALENTGEMHLLDRAIIRLAIEHLSQHKILHKISINLSAQAFKDEHLVPVIRECLAKNIVDPTCITFELTESASLFNLNVTKRVIDDLHQIGCTFAVDDFGSGFSSFAYLKELPADYIKLDGSFIRCLDTDEVDRALVKSLIQVVKALGKKSVAEFVENPRILQILEGFGVDLVQGYYICKPLAVDQLEERIELNSASC